MMGRLGFSRRLGFMGAIALLAGVLASCATPTAPPRTTTAVVAPPGANTNTQAAAAYLSGVNGRFIEIGRAHV